MSRIFRWHLTNAPSDIEGSACERGYVRELDAARACPGGGFELLARTEVLELIAASPIAIRALLDRLCGDGGLASIDDYAIVGSRAVIEYSGDLLLLCDFVDLVMPGITRRRVIALSDATLIAIAGRLWHDETLTEMRILERAAAGS